YLSVGRLVPNKRTDLLIEACNQSGRELIIVGEGPEKEYLSKIAGPTVSLTGRVSSARLADLFSKARAYLFAAEEDFGIATAEAQSYGLPVIAYKQGGTAEIISNDDLGVLFEDQTIDSVDGALSKFEAREHKFDRKLIQEHARKFGKERFVSEMRDFLQRCTSSQSDNP
ncbi:MAG: glycosyltransferase, partial [Pseudomonadota bacterium]